MHSGRCAVRGARCAVPVWERRGLSDRMRRLLSEGDVTGRYGGRDESNAGYRLTMALAGAAGPLGTGGQFSEVEVYLNN